MLAVNRVVNSDRGCCDVDPPLGIRDGLQTGSYYMSCSSTNMYYVKSSRAFD